MLGMVLPVSSARSLLRRIPIPVFFAGWHALADEATSPCMHTTEVNINWILLNPISYEDYQIYVRTTQERSFDLGGNLVTSHR
ncbi:hypothetical protein BJ165DRAFT_1467924 [Panaeolus papilionaceus]|nr:hypothetical protein BJ165DRAFT_1467924 [Panaeolus papilionaceus]